MASKLVFHHMNNSQSQRILWLLEELNIEYTLVQHFRNEKTKRAPPDLTALHPLGKIPILETPSGLVLAECSAIATYLLNTYDTAGTFHVDDVHSDAFFIEESLVSLGSATIGPLGVVQLVCDVATKAPPFPIGYLFSFLTAPVEKFWIRPETEKVLKYLEETIGEKEWFAQVAADAKEPGKADFMLSWNFDLGAQRGWWNLEKFPRLVAWRERVLARDAWKRALTKGNGYDLTQF